MRDRLERRDNRTGNIRKAAQAENRLAACHVPLSQPDLLSFSAVSRS